jgi:TRAP-type C4-dicarboxylate transport system substrate-binding protein
MMTRIFSLAVVAGLAFAASQAWAQEHRWDLANEYPPGSIHAQTADRFIEEAQERSGGQIAITAHHGSALGYKSLDQYDAVGDGAIQLASSFVGPWAGIDPAFLLPSLPFLAPSIEDTRALYDAARPYYVEVLEEANQVLLYATPWPPSGIWANKPVDSVDALSGLRIRTYDANGTVTMREAGANPIQLSWADTVPQLATGGVEAVLTSADGGAAAQLWEHQSHFTEVNYASPLQFVHMNKDVYDGLSDELRQAVDEAAAEAEDFGWGLLAERVEQNYEEMRSHDMTIVTDVPEEFMQHLSEAAQVALADWRERFDRAEELLAAYEERRGN